MYEWYTWFTCLSSTGDVLEMSVVRGVGVVCDMCMCLGFTNPVGTGGVLDVCLCFGCGGVGGEWAWTRVGSGGVVLCLCEVGVWILCVDGRSRYLCIVLGGYLHILGAPYGYLLSDMYLFVAEITNPDFFV